ncbi:MAG: hypothetical protein [Bacteriophage sp.]|nr:MAG: hypothetical protein [Bacteriophage sp.]
MALVNIEYRDRRVVNTDPQRRCYNGANFSEALHWSKWEVLEYGVNNDGSAERIKFWKELNDYAVSQRGEGARRELRIVPD